MTFHVHFSRVSQSTQTAVSRCACDPSEINLPDYYDAAATSYWNLPDVSGLSKLDHLPHSAIIDLDSTVITQCKDASNSTEAGTYPGGMKALDAEQN